MTGLLFVLQVVSACSPRERFWFERPAISDTQFERFKKECLQEAYKVMASARSDGAAIVYGEETYISCLELRGVRYKGKTVDWQ
jgi:hypothetical protein